MKRVRFIAVILTAFALWSFSPYLEYLRERPKQKDFNGESRMGLFTGHEGVDLLLSIDAEEGLRIFDVQAKIADKTVPLSWRLSPIEAKRSKIKKSGGDVVAEMEFPDDNHLTIISKSDTPVLSFMRYEDAPYKQYLIEYKNEGVELAATVFSPNSDAPTIGIVMIHGSGKSNRNNLWYVAQADYLARAGFTVLLPDKRGSGRSAGLWKTATMQDLADDTNAAVTALAGMRQLSVSRIGLMGLSQGGHVAPLAAAENDQIAFVVNVVGSLISFNEGLDHESRNLFRGHVPKFLMPPLIFVASQVARARIPIWWFKNGAFHSKPYWEALEVPGLIIWGAEDEYDNVAVASSKEVLMEINANRETPIDLKIYPGMGHGLFDESGWISQDYLSFVANWMQQIGNES